LCDKVKVDTYEIVNWILLVIMIIVFIDGKK
jgi:hypothetical protein